MEKRYHRQITREAIADLCSEAALGAIIRANVGQDNLIGQLFHPEYHFDENGIAESLAYIEIQRRQAREIIVAGGDIQPARAAFGRIAHAGQDFYAHSNYVALWLARSREDHQVEPSPEDIHPLEQAILDSPQLFTARVYYPLELLSFLPLPGMEDLMSRFLPPDSHTRTNLDAPRRGRSFAYAFAAARARTRLELAHLLESLDAAQAQRFCGTAGE